MPQRLDDACAQKKLIDRSQISRAKLRRNSSGKIFGGTAIERLRSHAIARMRLISDHAKIKIGARRFQDCVLKITR
jgi:hypothetical protein